MPNVGVDSQEIDFEDVIAQFERNLNRSKKENPPVQKVSSEESEEDGYTIIMNVAGLEPDLQVLCEVLMEHVQSNVRVSRRSSVHNREGTDEAQLVSGVLKEVFRTEIKATLMEMQTLRENAHEGSALLSSSERSTISSLKRQVRERDGKLKAIKQKLKNAQIVKYRLEHSVEGYQAAFKEYENANELLENEVAELRKQNAALTKRCSDAEVQYRREHQEKEGVQATLTKFRQEVLLAHQQAQNAKIETKQAKERLELFQKRAAETNASTAIVDGRIMELHEIQDQMVATMQGIKENGETTAARRLLENLKEKRSRLVGKIANLLLRNKKKVVNSGQEENQAQPSSSSDGSQEKTCAAGNGSSSPANRSDPTPENSNGQTADGDGLNKKQRFESFQRFGSELTKMATGRKSRRAILANVERTCQAVARDTEALREVIQLKQNEIERMEEELVDAIDRAEILEMALQKERQRKTLENRNMRNAAMEAARVEMRSFTTTRRKSTLFDWQSQTVKTEGKEGMSRIKTKTPVGVTTANDKLSAT